jgi:hypothetical protein
LIKFGNASFVKCCVVVVSFIFTSRSKYRASGCLHKTQTDISHTECNNGHPNFFRRRVISVIVGCTARVEISGIPNRALCSVIFIIYTERRGRGRRKLLDDLKERRKYSHLKEKVLDRTMWRARFGRGFGPVVRQTTKRNEYKIYKCSHG